MTKKLKPILKKALKREVTLSFEENDRLSKQMRELTNEYTIYINSSVKLYYKGGSFDRIIENILEYLYN